MSLLNLVKQIKNYKKSWDETLELIIKDSKDSDKFDFRYLNTTRPAIGSTGYGTIIFSKLFDKQINIESSLINSALYHMFVIVDESIDCEDCKKEDALNTLESFNNYLKSGEGFESLNPFRDFVLNKYPKQHIDALLNSLSKHKDTIADEINSTTYEDYKASRIDLGVTNGEYVGEIISAFSKDPLSQEQVEVLRSYTAGCTLLDDVSDYYLDKKAKHNNHISIALRDSKNNFLGVMSNEISDANMYFAKAKELVEPNKRKQFDNIVKLTKLFYTSSFVKKYINSLLDPIIYTQARVGKNGHPFKIYKFKTMKDKNNVNDANMVSNKFGKSVDYSRVTPVGKFMRKYWIDEIPQVINVLKGDMSIAGLRAINYEDFSNLPEDIQKQRIKYKPGVLDVSLPLMWYHKSNKNDTSRNYLLQKEKSSIIDIKCASLLFAGIVSGKLRGL